MTVPIETNPGIEALNRLGALFAEQPWFWAFFLGALALVTVCSLEAFRKRWLRAFIAGGLAVECAWVLCAGFFA